jgi:hypothetical protein
MPAGIVAIVILLSCLSTHAEVQLAQLFCDHMVTQRNVEVPVWGWAEPGEEITVTIDQQTKTSRTNADGKWMVRLDSMATGAPRKMTVKGNADSLEVNVILLGEVWLCSGQSNMSWPLTQAMGYPDRSATRRGETSELRTTPWSWGLPTCAGLKGSGVFRGLLTEKAAPTRIPMLGIEGQVTSVRCAHSFSLSRYSDGTPGQGWGEGPSSRRQEKTLTLSRSTRRGDKICSRA